LMDRTGHILLIGPGEPALHEAQNLLLAGVPR
jgi:hypothetical protein